MTTESAQHRYDDLHRDCPDCGRPQVQHWGEWVHLYQLDEPRCRPAETIPETKARLDRLKRNLGT